MIGADERKVGCVSVRKSIVYEMTVLKRGWGLRVDLIKVKSLRMSLKVHEALELQARSIIFGLASRDMNFPYRASGKSPVDYVIHTPRRAIFKMQPQAVDSQLSILNTDTHTYRRQVNK